MTSAFEERIGPIALLVNDPSEVAIVAVPWGGRLAREALDATECGILRLG